MAEIVAFKSSSTESLARGVLMHTVTTTAANQSDVEQIADLLHGKEQTV